MTIHAAVSLNNAPLTVAVIDIAAVFLEPNVGILYLIVCVYELNRVNDAVHTSICKVHTTAI
jgi:hypothetical protein